MFLNPLFGKRRYKGVCPPSKPGLIAPPERAPAPFCPRVEVLPIPEPRPRPTLLPEWSLPSTFFKL